MKSRRALPLLTFLALAGCSFFSRTQSRVYTLEIMPPATAPGITGSAMPAGIDSLELPPGFDRREIVVRKPDHGLEVRGTELWSASLAPLVLHTLASDLAGRLPVGSVILPGEAKPLAMRSVDLAFEDLSAGPGPVVAVDVRWVIREPGRTDLAGRENIRVTPPSLASADIATGTSQALATLADRLAARLAAR